jgi:hypothetical protein
MQKGAKGAKGTEARSAKGAKSAKSASHRITVHTHKSYKTQRFMAHKVNIKAG